MNPRALVLAAVAVVVLLAAAMYLRAPADPAPSATAPPEVTAPDPDVPSSPIPFERARSATRPPASAPTPDPTAPEARPPRRTEAEPDDDDAVDPEASPDDTADPDVDDDDLDEDDLRTIWSVDREGFDGAVREALPELRECYQEWLKVDPDIDGRVIFKFAVDVPLDGEAAEDGTPLAAITELRIEDSTVGHPMMESCAMNVFSDLWFSPPEDGTVWVSYPVVLERR